MAAKYKWIITVDHLESRSGECLVSGPHDAPAEVSKTFVTFKMYDDDGVLYYSGKLFGEYDGFEPLDDFGRSVGCTEIRVNGDRL